MNIGSAPIFAVDASSRIKEELVTYLQADTQGEESRKRSSTRTGWPLTTFSSAAILLDAVINRGSGEIHQRYIIPDEHQTYTKG
jgi:hypothetical protein